jgi:hypothetical protein
MTIHWKALEENILMVPLIFRFNHFGDALSEFFSRNLGPYRIKSNTSLDDLSLEVEVVVHVGVVNVAKPYYCHRNCLVQLLPSLTLSNQMSFQALTGSLMGKPIERGGLWLGQNEHAHNSSG